MKEREDFFEKGNDLESHGEHGKAIQMFLRAIEEDPTNDLFWSTFEHVFQYVQFTHFDGRLKYALTKCLERSIGNHQDLAFASVSLLKLYPPFQQVMEDYEVDKFDPSREFFSDFLFLGLMDKVIIADPLLEKFLTFCRRHLLVLFNTKSLQAYAEKIKPFLYGLAKQNWLNEYVYEVLESEQTIVDSLCRQIPWDAAVLEEESKLGIVLLGCYLPLYQIQNALSIGTDQDEMFGRFLQTHIREPFIEQELSKTIPTLGKVRNEISLKVQAHYETSPYPRWTSVYAKGLSPSIKKFTLPPHPEILIAGCGTGQHAFNTALQYPQAKLLAIDLSRKSLAYAIRKAAELNISNVHFLHADILELEPLENRFDVIECTGVLHHMNEPYEGWRVLAGLLKPGGVMHIGLYSALSRQDIIAARDYIESNHYEASQEGIRLCRQAILLLPDRNPIKQVSQSLDFYTLSGCRDLLFHVQEHHFSLPQIADLLSRLNLSFLDFEIRDETLRRKYHHLYPEDLLGRSLANWHRFELENPSLFRGMYQFWVSK